MNQSKEEIFNFFSELESLVVGINKDQTEIWLAPQFIHLPLLLELKAKFPFPLSIGAQNCAHEKFGAYTGEVSPYSLKELGVDFTLIGHSERRMIFQENNKILSQKVFHAFQAGLKVIFCVGETLEERDQGKAFSVVEDQIKSGLLEIFQQSEKSQNRPLLLLAYEPVWAIGTGKTASPEQAQEMHAHIKKVLHQLSQQHPLLYGGSVKPSNIGELLQKDDISGALVGGASLKANDFWQLCK